MTPDPQLIACLRETGRGRRVRHSFLGMVVAWFTGFCVVAAFNLGDLDRAIKFLPAWAAITALVCGVAWVLLALPVYWFWPRNRRCWGWRRVGLIGLVMGTFPAWVMVHGSLGWQMLMVMMVPGLHGIITALVAWMLEESQLRHMAENRTDLLNPA